MEPELAVKLLDRSIATTDCGFQVFSADDVQLASPILDRALLLQNLGRGCDARPVGPEHHRKKVVCHMKRTSRNSIVRHEQPPRHSLAHVVKTIAGCCLCDLHCLHGGKPACPLSKMGYGRKNHLKNRSRYSEPVARHFDNGAMRGLCQASEQGHSSHALVPTHADLYRFAVVQFHYQ